jgi:putative transcriptional regulator
MQIRWKPRMAAAQREVWTGARLQRLLAEKAGLELSSASVSALFTIQPSQIELSTLIALCTALECTPTTCLTSIPPQSRKQSHRSRPKSSSTTRQRHGGAGRCRRSEHDPTDPGLPAVWPRSANPIVTCALDATGQPLTRRSGIPAHAAASTGSCSQTPPRAAVTRCGGTRYTDARL